MPGDGRKRIPGEKKRGEEKGNKGGRGHNVMSVNGGGSAETKKRERN